jgi:transcriptional regulator with XRE-family HTH domain
MSKRGGSINVGLSQAAVDVLRYLKRRYDYRRLSSIISISASTLSRYVTGKTMPRAKNAKKILERSLEIVNPREIVKEYFGNDLDIEGGVYISHDVQTLKILASYALNTFMGTRVNSSLALDIPSIPLAACFSSLIGGMLYFALDRPIWHDGEYLEVSYRSPGTSRTERLWFPSDPVKKNSSMVIFTSFILSPSPVREVLRTLERHKTHVAGLFTLVTVKDTWDRLSVTPGCRRIALLIYERPE